MANNIDFLQSEEWRKFQASTGKKTFHIDSSKYSSDCHFKKDSGFFWANIIAHQLPIVGKYFYIPRGPLMPNLEFQIINSDKFLIRESQNFFGDLINLAKKEKARWIRIEPENEKILQAILKNKNLFFRDSIFEIQKAPHDVQPKEIFVIDITKSEEELLAKMKQKTRYNIKIAQKKGVFVRLNPKSSILNSEQASNSNCQNSKFYIDRFVELVKITAKRDKIIPHPENYYRQMFKTIPENILKLYIAEYAGKIIAANIIIHYGDTAIYLHGASDNEHRNVMAPYLLQWQAILDAKKAGCVKYDLGGVKMLNFKSKIPNPKQIQNSKFQIQNITENDWQGITRFKIGFSSNTKPVIFPGSYDIVINPKMYFLYRLLQRTKNIFA